MQALRSVSRELAAEMAGETELWPLRLKVIDTHPALLARLAAAFGKSEDWESLMADQIHPNEQGQQLWVETVSTFFAR